MIRRMVVARYYSFAKALGAFLCAATFCCADDGGFIGSQSCNSTACHGRLDAGASPGGLRGQEFSLFVQHDPHAKARRTLLTPEFEAILRRLGGDNEAATAKVYSQCAQCHDPEGIGAAKTAGSDYAAPRVSYNFASRGIGCESCHGGAKEWVNRHFQRGVSKSSLAAAGMKDTEDLLARGKLCASCHVGDSEHDMNHDILAAGHPPLRFEMTAYHRKLTSHDFSTGKQSHWNDARERIATADFEIKLWSAGQVTTAKAALELLVSRAHRAAQAADDSPAAAWPEFAEYNCFDCHRRLRPQAGNLKNKEFGSLAWGKWTFALTESLDSKAGLDELRGEMRDLFAAQPAPVEKAAVTARTSLLSEFSPRETSATRILELLSQPVVTDQSWDGRCQRYLGLLAVQKSIGDEFQKLEIAGQVRPAARSAFNEQRKQVSGELRAIGELLSFADDKKEWPRVLSTDQGLQQVDGALDMVAKHLWLLQKSVEREL